MALLKTPSVTPSTMQVPGSVEEERLFSRLAFIKNERRNHLDEEHLNVRLILSTQRMWNISNFPFDSAMRKWADARPRRINVQGQPRKQRKQHESEVTELGDFE